MSYGNWGANSAGAMTTGYSRNAGRHGRRRDDGAHSTPPRGPSAPRGRILLIAVLLLALAIAAIFVLRAIVDPPPTGPPAATFVVEGDRLTMSGLIGPSTEVDLTWALRYGTDVTTIVMTDVPGSRDDTVYRGLAQLVRDLGLSTHVPADGKIAAGGVDFFLAGATRSYEPGATFGVRSWATGELSGDDLPRDDAHHDGYLGYHAALGTDEGFYWFTLNAAPADSIHFMTDAELQEFGFND